jgi:hypothetical protein
MNAQVTGPRNVAIVAAEAAEAYGNKVTNLVTTVQQTQPASAQCVWHLGSVIGIGHAERAALGWLIADAVMSHRGGASRVADLWRSAALGGVKLTGNDRQLVEAFVAGVFGLPPSGKSEVHLTGHVAEWLWYLHSLHSDHFARSIALLDHPKFNVTEPGGDGFIVFSNLATGELSYRLWELKQHVGASSVSDTVGDAYRQLKAHATRYLAQLTAIHSTQSGPVGELCSRLVDLWIDCEAQAGAGVGVASATLRVPGRCFSTMGKHFPGFNRAGQLEGLLLTVEDLAGLARDVRDYLWIVL